MGVLLDVIGRVGAMLGEVGTFVGFVILGVLVGMALLALWMVIRAPRNDL